MRVSRGIIIGAEFAVLSSLEKLVDVVLIIIISLLHSGGILALGDCYRDVDTSVYH